MINGADQMIKTISFLLAFLVVSQAAQAADHDMKLHINIISPFDRNPVAVAQETDAYVEVRPDDPVIDAEMVDSVSFDAMHSCSWSANVDDDGQPTVVGYDITFVDDPNNYGAFWAARIQASFEHSGDWDVWVSASLEFQNINGVSFAGSTTTEPGAVDLPVSVEGSDAPAMVVQTSLGGPNGPYPGTPYISAHGIYAWCFMEIRDFNESPYIGAEWVWENLKDWTPIQPGTAIPGASAWPQGTDIMNKQLVGADFIDGQWYVDPNENWAPNTILATEKQRWSVLRWPDDETFVLNTTLNEMIIATPPVLRIPSPW